MGRKVFIDDEFGPITEICWVDTGGKEERISKLGGKGISICNSNNARTRFFKADLPKLKAAIDKAIEFKWHLEGE